MAVCVRDDAGKPRWMLLDSGAWATFVRGDGAAGGTLRLTSGENLPLRVKFRKTPGYFVWNVDIAPDGVLGADTIARLTWFVDYKNSKVWVRPAARKPALEAALAVTGRKTGETFALPLLPNPEDGTWWVSLAQGDGAARRWTLDTGANIAAVPPSLPGIGAPLTRLDSRESDAERERDGHLLRLRLPGGPVPLLAYSHADDAPDDLVLGPWSLTRDWMLFDPLGGRAVFPKASAEAMAGWAAEWLTRGALTIMPPEIRERVAPPALLRGLSKIGSAGDLARARAAATQICENFERERAKALAEHNAASAPPPPGPNTSGYFWAYYPEPGVWGEVLQKERSVAVPAPPGKPVAGHRWVYFDDPVVWGMVPGALGSALPPSPPRAAIPAYCWRYVPNVGWVEIPA